MKATCPKCGARILYVVTERGTRMPIDPMPSPEGNIEIAANGLAVLRVRDKPAGVPLYAHHHRTCSPR